jgi:hypothetical protein
LTLPEQTMQLQHPRLFTTLTVVLTVLLVIATWYGLFVPATYARDSASMGAQGMGQDAIDLFVVVPLMLASLALALRGSRAAFLVLAGTCFYVLYSYVVYAFGVHFNRLFLVYCAIFGISFYTFLLCVMELNRLPLQRWFGERTPNRATGIFFLVIAVLFYLLWLKDVVPAIWNNSVPVSVSNNDLLVNPVHVLDIAIALPGLMITAILLLRKHPLGYLFGPVYLVFTVLLALALVAMVIAMKQKGIADDLSIAEIFIVLAAIGTVLLFRFLRALEH